MSLLPACGCGPPSNVVPSSPRRPSVCIGLPPADSQVPLARRLCPCAPFGLGQCWTVPTFESALPSGCSVCPPVCSAPRPASHPPRPHQQRSLCNRPLIRPRPRRSCGTKRSRAPRRRGAIVCRQTMCPVLHPPRPISCPRHCIRRAIRLRHAARRPR